MNTNRIWIACCFSLFLALALMLAQHWGMTFSNSDDPWIAQLGLQGSIDTAKAQGRFWLVPINIIAQIPYLLDSWVFANSIKIVVNGITLLSFILFCAKLTNKQTGLLMGLVWLALIDINSSDFSPIHGYLLMFNLQLGFLFLSFYMYLARLEKNDAQPIVTPYLLFAFSLLAYEPMFFYSMVFPALYLYKQITVQNAGIKFNLFTQAKKFLSQNIALVVVLALYILLYFGFRKYYATGTRGLDAEGNPYEVIKTIFGFSVHGFHLQLKSLTTSVLELYAPLDIFLAVFFAGSILFGMFLIIPRIEENLTPSDLYRKKSIVILGFFIFSPNILFGFVDGYRKWAAHDPHYVGNYLSSFPLAMAVTLAVLYLVGGNKSKHEKVLFLLILYVFFSSACDNYLRWEKLAESNRKGSALWQKAIQQLSQRSFDTHRQTLICGNNTPEHVAGDNKYWSQYLSKKFSANIQYSSNRVSMTACDVILDLKAN